MKLSRLTNSSIKAFALAGLTVCAAPVFAGWSSSETPKIAGMDTWIYTPASSSQSRSMLVVLHGCAQQNDLLKDYGNLEAAAEAHNTVMVVPYRPSAWSGGLPGTDCWAYDEGIGVSQTEAHTTALATLTETIAANTSYNIDEDRIYITGLSSGGGMARIMGCARPDLYAGVDSVAGPTVGAPQSDALNSQYNESGLISEGISVCGQLAGTLSTEFSDQVSHITWGERDLQGNNPGGSSTLGDPGEIALVSVVYSKANYKVARDIYGTNAFGSQTRVTSYGGAGASTASSLDAQGNTRVTYLSIDDVGHAWPAAKPGTQNGGASGKWIAHHDMNYPAYLMDWFETHNLRGNDKPVVTITSTDSTSSSASLTCTATDSDGTVDQVDFELLQNNAVVASDIGGTNCATNFTGIAEGYYTIRVTATDDAQGVGVATSASIQVGNPPDNPPVVSVSGSASGQTLSASGSASDDLGLASVTADLMQGASVVASQTVAPASDGSFSVDFDDVAEGTYTIRITATDSASQTESATTDVLESIDVGSTGNVQFHIDEGHITFGVGYSTCYLEYGASAAFTMSEVSQGGGQCRWEDDDASCYGPVQACSGGGDPDPDPDPEGCEEHTTSNYYHKTGGRAYSTGSYWSPDYFANGSDDAMPGSTWGSTTLHSLDGSYWEVGACP